MFNFHTDNFTYSLRELFKMSAMSYFQTGNEFIDQFLRLFLLIIFSSMSTNVLYKLMNFNFKIKFKNFWKNRRSITIVGTRYTDTVYHNVRCEFSVRFQAIIDIILSSVRKLPENDKLIYNMDEFLLRETTKYYDDTRTREHEFNFIVSQNNEFKIDTDIFCEISTYTDNDERKDTKAKFISQKYTIRIWSYKKTCSELYDYVEKISDLYEEKMKSESAKSKYIFKFDGRDKENHQIKWHVSKFNSKMTLDSIFFDGKDEIISFINRFMKEKELYDKIGKPWQLGILLEGEPGCGKTSFIKAISNHFNRSIKDLQFNRMKTIDDLEGCINCISYNNKSMEIDNVIMVAEDFDCMQDITRSRTADEKEREKLMKIQEEKNKEKADLIKSMKSDEAKAIMSIVNNEDVSYIPGIPYVSPKKDERDITLSSFLNIMDGIYSYDGRIIIFSTNHPEKIDEACLRPGRIDLRIKFKRLSRNMLYQMMSHWYKSYDEFYFKNYYNEFDELWNKYEFQFIDETLKPCDVVNILQRNGFNVEETLLKLVHMQ